MDDGTSICDFDEEEKQHRYTIEASVVHCDHGGKHFQLIDTPGYPDFIGQAIGAMRGVDTAAIVINAQSGIEVNTRRVFAEAKKAGLGRMIVFNKMDSDNIDFPTLVDNIQELFGKGCVLFNVPLGQGPEFRGVAGTLKPPADAAGALIDPDRDQRIAVGNDRRGRRSRSWSGTSRARRRPTRKSPRLIVKAVAQGSLVPMSAFRARPGSDWPSCSTRWPFAPAARRGQRTAKNAAGEEVEVKADPAGPLVAQVFKTRIDPFVQKLNFIRVFSGTLKKDDRTGGRACGRASSSACWTCRAMRPNRSRRSGRAGSWPSPRWRTCTPARRGRVDHAADPVPHADGRTGRQPQEPRRRRQALRRLAQDLRRGLDVPPGPRPPDQGNGHHRHERAALADRPRAAQAPR